MAIFITPASDYPMNRCCSRPQKKQKTTTLESTVHKIEANSEEKLATKVKKFLENTPPKWISAHSRYILDMVEPIGTSGRIRITSSRFSDGTTINLKNGMSKFAIIFTLEPRPIYIN